MELAFLSPSPMELMVIAMIALIVLGPSKLPEVARSVGRGMREMRDSFQGIGDYEDDDGRRSRAIDAEDEDDVGEDDVDEDDGGEDDADLSPLALDEEADTDGPEGDEPIDRGHPDGDGETGARQADGGDEPVIAGERP